MRGCQVHAAATVHKHMQAGEHDARHGCALQSLPDITVGNGDAEVDHEHLKAGERAKQCGKVC